MRPRNIRQLTWRTFLGDLPIHSRCSNQLSLTSVRFIAPSSITHIQCRTFLSKFTIQRSKTPSPAVPPGHHVLKSLTTHLDRKIGAAPDPEQLIFALTRMAKHFSATRALRDEQAKMMLKAYRYLFSNPSGRMVPPLATELISAVLVAVSNSGSNTGRPNQVSLATLLWKDLTAREDYVVNVEDVFSYVKILCLGGSSLEAEKLCLQYAERFPQRLHFERVWTPVLEAFVKGGNKDMLFKALEYMRGLDGGIPPRFYHYPITYYCQCKDLENARVWYEKAIADGHATDRLVHVILITACLHTSQFEFGERPLEEFMEACRNHPTIPMEKSSWDIVLRFSVATEKYTEELLRLMSQNSTGTEGEVVKPDVSTFNGIMETALHMGKVEMAGRCPQLLKDWGLEPNYITLDLKIKVHLKRGDVANAAATFDDLKFTQDIPKEYAAEGPQQLLGAMAKKYPECQANELKDLYENIIEMNILLIPDALIPLIRVFLEESDFQLVAAILNHHVGHYSRLERKPIAASLIRHMESSTTPVETAWETYLILVRTFPETTNHQRHNIMNLFFELDKPLAAVRVLEHMASTEDRKPNRYQYTAALTGIAHCKNIQCLQKVHRMISMDPQIEIDTIFRNTLMMAYARCGLLERAFFIYEEITSSRDGPNHGTISQVLDMCGRLKGGLVRAQKLWAGFRRMRLPLSENNTASYVEALARHEAWDMAWLVVKTMEAELGIPPGRRVLTTLYSTFRRDRLVELEKWMELHHKNVWLKIKSRRGVTVNEESKKEVVGDDTSIDPETGKELVEQPGFKPSLNLEDSYVHDATKAAAERKEWATLRKEDGEDDEDKAAKEVLYAQEEDEDEMEEEREKAEAAAEVASLRQK